MTVEDLKARMHTELPELLKQDAGFRQWLEQLIRQTAVTPESFDARFERTLQELAADRAERRHEWEEWSAKFDAHAEEQNRKWDEQNRKNNELLEELNDHQLKAGGLKLGGLNRRLKRIRLKPVVCTTAKRPSGGLKPPYGNQAIPLPPGTSYRCVRLSLGRCF